MPWKWYESRVVEIVDLTAHTKSFWLKIMMANRLILSRASLLLLTYPFTKKDIKDGGVTQ